MAALPPPPVPQGDPNPTPLTRYALQDINTPCQTDGFYVELVSRQDSAYQKETPIKRGTPYAGIYGADQRIIDQYSSNPLYFLKQTADVDSMRVLFGSQFDQFVIWIWATQTLSQDTYNSHITYAEESITAPTFERVSTIKRHVWETAPTITYLNPLTALLSVAITAAGTGYTYATGTTGNATAVAVCFNGAIIDWIVTVEGSSIVSGAALTITGDGTGATATARIQPASVVLTHQEKRELPDADPLSHDYVQIIDLYETLPGPLITSTRWGPEGQVITTTRQKKVLADIVSSETLATGIWTVNTKGPGDSITALQITESEPISGPSITDTKHDEESNVSYTVTRTKRAISAITPGVTHNSDNTVTVIEEDQTDSQLVAYEVATVFPKGDFYDVDHAKIEDQMLPFEFPGYIISQTPPLVDGGIDLTTIDLYGEAMGQRQAYSETVVHTKKTWWVIGTKPSLAFDEISPADITLNSVVYRKVLHDDLDRNYGIIITVPATTPSFTEYYGEVADITADPFIPGTGTKWIGTSRVIRGGVTMAGNNFRWKVESISVVMR